MTEYTRQIFARIIAQSTQNRKDGHAQYQVAFEADIAHAGLAALEDFLDGAVVECDVGVGGVVCGFKKTLFADASGQSETGQADADDAACKFRQLALLLWILLYQVVDKGK